MGFRFSKRISICPGVRVNLSGSGASLSLGPKGASVTLGKRGVHANVGVPGTGLSYRSRLDRPARSTSVVRALPEGVRAELNGDAVEFVDSWGRPIDPALLPATRRLLKEDVLRDLRKIADDRNLGNEALRRLHSDRPVASASGVKSIFGAKPFRDAFGDDQSHAQALMEWRAATANAESDHEAIEDALIERLGALEWPRPTDIAMSFVDGRLLLDVDLPEIEEMPERRWLVDETGPGLREKALSARERAGLYLDHICSLVVRLIDHSMAAAGSIRIVAVSGYTQRTKASGVTADDYVATVEVMREGWQAIGSSFDDTEPRDLLRHFGARIETDGRGILKKQSPLA